MHKAIDEANLPSSSSTGSLSAQEAANIAAVEAILYQYQSPSWVPELTTLMNGILVQIYSDGIEKSAEEVGQKEFDSFMINANLYALERTATLVSQLDDSTRKMLRADLIHMMNDGKTPKQIEIGIQKNYAFSESRAETIARTETAFTWNHAGISTYRDAGAKAVTVFDGDYDEDCADADGQVWTFDYALEHRLQHPRCVRSFGPEMEGKTPDRGLVTTGGEAVV